MVVPSSTMVNIIGNGKGSFYRCYSPWALGRFKTWYGSRWRHGRRRGEMGWGIPLPRLTWGFVDRCLVGLGQSPSRKIGFWCVLTLKNLAAGTREHCREFHRIGPEKWYGLIRRESCHLKKRLVRLGPRLCRIAYDLQPMPQVAWVYLPSQKIKKIDLL